jgi:hypothetical protein
MLPADNFAVGKPKRHVRRPIRMITSRERVNLALQHKEPDRIPLDLGGTIVTGMHVSTVYNLRQALGLDKPGTPLKVIEPYQMLGEIKPDLIAALGADVVGVMGTGTPFGFRLEGMEELWWYSDISTSGLQYRS